MERQGTVASGEAEMLNVRCIECFRMAGCLPTSDPVEYAGKRRSVANS